MELSHLTHKNVFRSERSEECPLDGLIHDNGQPEQNTNGAPAILGTMALP